MASVPVKRRLAAIMATDVVGFARLMESDEEATLALIKACDDGVVPFVCTPRAYLIIACT